MQLRRHLDNDYEIVAAKEKQCRGQTSVPVEKFSQLRLAL